MSEKLTTSKLPPKDDRAGSKFVIVTTAQIKRPEPKPREPGKKYLDFDAIISTNNLEKIQKLRAEEAKKEATAARMKKAREAKGKK